MVAHRYRLGLHLPAPRNGHNHLADVFAAVAAIAAVATQGMSCRALRFAALSLLVRLSRGSLEHEVLLDIRLQALAAIFNTDFLTVIKHMPMPGAEAAGAILTLSQQRFAASSQATSVVAAGGLVIFANFHASCPAPTAAPPPKHRRRTEVRLTRRRVANPEAGSTGRPVGSEVGVRGGACRGTAGGGAGGPLRRPAHAQARRPK